MPIDNFKDVIHTSKWAITRRDGNIIRKEFLYDNFSKINKECALLQLGTGNVAKVFYDVNVRRWVCETPFIELKPIFLNGCVDSELKQIKDTLTLWNKNKTYVSLVTDEWSQRTIPWYCGLLCQFVPDSAGIAEWIKNIQGKNFIHGDFTLSNVFLDEFEKLVVLDYENASLGPDLWDATTLVYSLIENKQYESALQLYKAFACDKEMLLAISYIRLAQSLSKGSNVDRRKVALRFVNGMFNGNSEFTN